MLSVYKRELKSYFASYTGYIFTAFMLLTTGVYSWYINYLNQSPEFEYILFNLNFIYLIAVPILTMKTISEERRQKTDILLYSLPLSGTAIVFGKYFAQLTVLLIPTTVICLYPLLLMMFGTISTLTCYSTIFGFFLMGAALIAVGMFVSSLTDNPTVAAISTFAVLFISYLSSIIANGMSTAAITSLLVFFVITLLIAAFVGYITKNSVFAIMTGTFLLLVLTAVYLFFPALFEGAVQKVFNSLSLFDRLSYFVTGIFDLSSVIYYLSVCALFCFTTVQTVEKRRWS